MNIQRTITILLPNDDDLRQTILEFQALQNRLSPLCYNNGKLLGALQLQRENYDLVKGAVNSQMTIMAMRLVSGAYLSANKGYQRRLAAEARRKAKFERKGWNYKPRHIRKPGICDFNNPSAMFLIGSRGRDASFLKNDVLSIWTVAGRKKLSYTIPEAFQRMFSDAAEINSITVIERGGKLIGRVTLTLDTPEPNPIHPIGIDLNETNALVAVDADDNTFFVSGRAMKIKNKRHRRTRKRLQAKLSSRKAQKKDTRSLRRLLKRQGRKNSNRTRTFCQTVAKQVCSWAKPDSVLVLEDLSMPQPQKGTVRGKNLRRRLSLWQFGIMRECIQNRAEIDSLAIALVNPAYTSQDCNRCGLRGIRKRHKFHCPHCGHVEHADVNAGRNIRDRSVVFRHDGELSVSPTSRLHQRACTPDLRDGEALDTTVSEGKPTTLVVGI